MARGSEPATGKSGLMCETAGVTSDRTLAAAQALDDLRAAIGERGPVV
jgi:hypothetical protein